TPRRRYIVLAARVEGVQLADIADQLGVSQRLVEKELKAALMLCGARLKREVVQRFGPRAGRASQRRASPSTALENSDD
ncbi:sigma-70 region 4 domain-containing protein, partial [Microbacteriaceae bacterium K1510]|nr:sigma-70 region 4 domain-containing protein [Microbacteriaceae bacterium K1510]